MFFLTLCDLYRKIRTRFVLSRWRSTLSHVVCAFGTDLQLMPSLSHALMLLKLFFTCALDFVCELAISFYFFSSTIIIVAASNR